MSGERRYNFDLMQQLNSRTLTSISTRISTSKSVVLRCASMQRSTEYAIKNLIVTDIHTYIEREMWSALARFFEI